MNREEGIEIAKEATTAAIIGTNESALQIGDLVVILASDKIQKIISIEGEHAILDDTKQQTRVLLVDCAYAEIYKVEVYKRLYGDRLITIIAPL